jgi:SAM-dependent methyltransferase/uncharacterized protein YbaR (Trm112 family)
MRAKWLEHLVDPETRQPLKLENSTVEGDEVVSGTLRSSNGRTYPIVRGIPRFISETLDSASSTPGTAAAETVKCYGNYWAKAEEVQGGVEHTPAEIKQFTEVLCGMLGISGPSELPKLFRDGANVLNAGCGIAWSEYVFNVNPKANRFGVDLSSSIEIAYQRTRALPNACMSQADIFGLPFKPNHFDVIFSGGVLHHIPDSAGAFSSLCKHLAPGGTIGIFVYKVKPFLREMADREIKKITTGLSQAECETFSRQMTALGRALQKIAGKIEIEEDIPLLDIKAGSYGVQKFLYDHFLKCYYNDSVGFEQSVLANIDWYAPKHATHHTQEEVHGWFAKNGLEQIKFMNLPGWEHASFFVSGRKPG